MKKVDKSKLQLNKFIKVFKYIVLIVAFAFVGMMINDIEVKADYAKANCSASSNNDTKCYNNTKADSSGIRLDVDFGSRYTEIRLVVCPLNYSSNNQSCSFSKTIRKDKSNKTRYMDISIDRTGSVSYHYKLKNTGSWTSWTSLNYSLITDLRYAQSSSGFVVKLSAYDASGNLERWAEVNVDYNFYFSKSVVSLTSLPTGWSSSSFDLTVNIQTYLKTTSTKACWDTSTTYTAASSFSGSTTGSRCKDISYSSRRPTFSVVGTASSTPNYLYVTVTNGFGETFTTYIGSFNFDNINPSISFSYSAKRSGSAVTFSSSNWHQSVTVTPSFTDSISGIDSSTKKYCLVKYSDSGCANNYIDYSNPIEIKTSGEWKVCAQVFDNADVFSYGCTEKIKVDATIPSLTVSFPNRDWINSSGISISTSSWSISDSGGSGISTRTYKWNSGTATSFVVGNKISLPSSITTGTATLTITVVDGAGNSISESKSYSVDKSSPTISFGTVNVVAGLSTNNGSSFSVQVNVTDSGGSNLNTGTVTYWWKNSNGTAKTSVQTAKLSNGTFTAYLNKDSGLVSGFQKEGLYLVVTASDNSGNAVETASTVCVTLDVKAPTITFISSSNKSQSALQVVESVMMSQIEESELLEQKHIVEGLLEEDVKDLIQTEEKEVVKVMNNEVIQVEHTHIPSTVSILDYVLGSLKSSIVIGGTYLFIKQRKRVNVS